MQNLRILQLCLFSCLVCLTAASFGFGQREPESEQDAVALLATRIFRMWGMEPEKLTSSCSYCNPRCRASCGTRKFRWCCYNYMRKKRGERVGEAYLDFVNERVPSVKALASLWSNRMLNLDEEIL